MLDKFHIGGYAIIQGDIFSYQTVYSAAMEGCAAVYFCCHRVLLVGWEAGKPGSWEARRLGSLEAGRPEGWKAWKLGGWEAIKLEVGKLRSWEVGYPVKLNQVISLLVD
jgi:hypothetical protein